MESGTDDPVEAAAFLTRSVITRVPGTRLGPILLGIAIAALIIAMVVLAPATESHFIYTDF